MRQTGPIAASKDRTRQNKTLEEMLAAKITADTDARIPQSAQTAERFIKFV